MVKNRLKIYVSPFTLIMCVCLAITDGVTTFFVYAFTVAAHEFSHAVVAERLGYALDRISVMPYGAALSGRFETMKAKDEILIAIAGPLANVVIAVLTIAAWWMFPSLYAFTCDLASANIYTALFNVLPVFPLDGGRVALAALSIKYKREKAYKTLRKIGYVVSFLFIFAFILMLCFRQVNITLASAGVFMLISTVLPESDSAYRSLYNMAYLRERLKKGIRVKRIMIADSVTLLEMRRMLNPEYYTVFVVVNEKMKEKEISELELERISVNYAPTDSVGNCITK